MIAAHQHANTCLLQRKVISMDEATVIATCD